MMMQPLEFKDKVTMGVRPQIKTLSWRRCLPRCLGQKNQKEMTLYLPKIRTLTKFLGKIAKLLLDEANDFSCATTDVLAFKMLYLTSFF